MNRNATSKRVNRITDSIAKFAMSLLCVLAMQNSSALAETEEPKRSPVNECLLLQTIKYGSPETLETLADIRSNQCWINSYQGSDELHRFGSAPLFDQDAYETVILFFYYNSLRLLMTNKVLFVAGYATYFFLATIIFQKQKNPFSLTKTMIFTLFIAGLIVGTG